MNRPRARRPRFPAERGTLWPRLASLAAGAALLLASLPGSEPALVFVDVALQAGLSQKNIFGDPANKRYTLEVTGNGCAFFDYDRDGHQDILLVNGSTLEGFRKVETRCATFTAMKVKADFWKSLPRPASPPADGGWG